MQLFPTEQFKRFLKETFFFGATIAIVVFAWVRTLFFEVPFSLLEDSLNLSRIILTSWLIIAGFRAGWYLLIHMLESMQQKRVWTLAVKQNSLRWMIVVVLSAVLFACNAQPAGFYKNATTGMTTTYSGMTTSETRMVMNGEVLNHTDIPLGEKFTIINDGVKGLVVKDNKISVGCSLVITDKNGNKMLEEKDLFAQNGIFDKDKITYLQCQINTGKPMEWQETYTVKVRFWDKYGKGSIENVVSFLTIDEP